MTHQFKRLVDHGPAHAVHKTAEPSRGAGYKPVAGEWRLHGKPLPSTEAEDPCVDRYELLLLAIVALPLLATYVLCSVDALDQLVGLGLGLGALMLLSAAQGAIGASFFNLLARECRRWAESLVSARRAG